MIEMSRTLKTEYLFFSATIMSVVIHCMIASLLLICIKSMTRTPFSESVISVDIRSLEPDREEKPHVSQPPITQPVVKLHSEPPARIMPVKAQIQKPAQLQAREPTATPSIAGLTGKQPVSQPLQERNNFADKALSPHGGTNPADMTFSVKSAPARGTEAADIHVSQAYLAALKEIIERSKEYPLLARRGRMEGTVRISCKLTRSGELREAVVAGSSGHEILDNAALRSVRSVGQFPVVPSELKGDPFCFIAPITFRLARE
jgi:protein TonB